MSEPETLAAIFARLGVTPSDMGPEEYQDAVAHSRAAVWARACALGRCRYMDAPATQENPPAVDSTITCGGYVGAKHPPYAQPDGPSVWHWRPCARHLRWSHERAEYLRTERDRFVDKKKGASGRPNLDD